MAQIINWTQQTIMSTEQEDHNNAVQLQRTIVFHKWHFASTIKKMRAFQPDFEYWYLVLMEYRAWDKVNENRDPIYRNGATCNLEKLIGTHVLPVR